MKHTKQLLREYDISFAGLKEGVYLFDFEITKAFFTVFEYDEFDDVQQQVQVKLVKRSSLMELFLQSSGTVTLPCDVTGELFELPTTNTLELVVKFGEVYNDDSDKFLVLPVGEYKLNVAQYIYEMIVLSVPLKRLSPEGEKKEEVQSEILYLEQKEIDPRWSKLKELLNK